MAKQNEVYDEDEIACNNPNGCDGTMQKSAQPGFWFCPTCGYEHDDDGASEIQDRPELYSDRDEDGPGNLTLRVFRQVSNNPEGWE